MNGPISLSLFELRMVMDFGTGDISWGCFLF